MSTESHAWTIDLSFRNKSDSYWIGAGTPSDKLEQVISEEWEQFNFRNER